MKSKEVVQPRAKTSIASSGVLCAFALVFVVSSQPITGSEDSFIRLHCSADTTVGLHDAYQEEDSTEMYEPRVFLNSEFNLFENRTFRDLLAEESVDLYLTLQDEQTKVNFEYSCSKVNGRGKRLGYSCVNSPPTEMLAFDPVSLRFSRASVGGWTFYTAEDLNDSAVLFVEKGTCVHAPRALRTPSQEQQEEQSN